MRLVTTLLTLALGAAVLVTMVAPDATLGRAGVSWFPAEVGRGAEIVDGLFDTINVVAVVLLVLTLGLLAWVVWRGAGRRAEEGSQGAGSLPLELVWTAVPAAILAFLTWAQVNARAEIAEAVADSPGEEPALVVEVEGSQFDWRFGYAGADGVFGTLDDVVEVVEMALPIGRTVELRMRTVDVLHSFFVPALRLKRDLVPGSVVPLRFHVDADDYEAAGRPETLELRCAELCGWGHYAMVGRLRPLEAAAFDDWLEREGAARFAAGNFDDDQDEGDD